MSRIVAQSAGAGKVRVGLKLGVPASKLYAELTAKIVSPFRKLTYELSVSKHLPFDRAYICQEYVRFRPKKKQLNLCARKIICSEYVP